MKRDLQARLREVEQQRRLHRLACQAADRLMFALQIREDRTLVPVLSDQPAASNREALAHWVAMQLDPSVTQLTAEDYDQLGRALRNHLDRIREAS